MSHFLDRLKFMSRVKSTFSDGHGAVVEEDRKWENAYRSRWQHDKIVRSTHGVNCGFLFLEGVCQEWLDYLGNPADRLSAHPS
jgi:nitrate reductase alpha subunit